MDAWRYYFKEVNVLDNVDEALNVAMKRPLENGDVQSLYLKHVIDEIAGSGSYMAITKDVLFLHTRDHESVRRPFISYIHVKEPMAFYEKRIRHIFAFGSFDDAMHRRMLSGLSLFIGDLREDDALMDEASMKSWFDKHN